MSHNWTLRTSNAGAGNALYDAAYGDSKLVAVGEGGAVVVSTNSGATWAAASSPPGGTNVIRGVCFGNGYWVAVGRTSGGIHKLWTATDPAGTWTERTISGWTGGGLTAVAYQAGTGFVAVGGGSVSNRGIASTGTDPTTGWTQRTSGAAFDADMDVATNGTMFVVVGGGNLSTSTDGTTWTRRDLKPITLEPRFDSNYAVAYGGGRWVVTGDDGASTTQGVLWTTDPTTWTSWTAVDTPLTGVPQNLEYGDVFLSRYGTTVYISTDGSSWAEDDVSFFNTNPVDAPDFIGGAGYGGGVWVVVGDDGGGDPYLATGVTPYVLQTRLLVDGSLVNSVSLTDAPDSIRRTPSGQQVFVKQGTGTLKRYDRALTLEATITISSFFPVQDWAVDDALNIYRLSGNVLYKYGPTGSAAWNVNLNTLYGYRYPSQQTIANGTGQQVVTQGGVLRVAGYDGGADWTAGSKALLLTLDRADGSLVAAQRWQGDSGDDAQACAVALSPQGCVWLTGAAQGNNIEGTSLGALRGWLAKLPVAT